MAERMNGGGNGRRGGGRPSGDRGGSPRQSRGGSGRPDGRAAGGGRRRAEPGQPPGGSRNVRPQRRDERAQRPPEPDLPEDIHPQMLDGAARARLRTLGKANADLVARHLVVAGQLLESDPERAYQHTQAAQRRAGRVDVVREAMALTAYATGRYAEALRELRTARRLSGLDAHRAVEADCERGLGRPERALAVVAEADISALGPTDRAELAMVASGARADLGEYEAGLLVLDGPLTRTVTDPQLVRRLALVRADRLDELGRTEEAAAVRAAVGPDPEELENEVDILELEDEPANGAASAAEAPGPGEEQEGR